MNQNHKKHLFVSYKAIGFVANKIPICVGHYRRRKEPYVVTCVGRAFHTYNCNKLAIVNISDSLPGEITCLKLDDKYVYASSGKLIYIFIQWKKVWRILKGHESDVKVMYPFADHLISVDHSNHLKVWTVEDGELYSEMHFDSGIFDVSAIEHPREYLNKVLIGSQQGSMKLINLMHNKIIYSYEGWSSGITVMKQSQAVNVVGVGLRDGRIVLHDLKFDESLMTFKQDWGPVTNISFRTDVPHIMIVGSAAGHIGVWNLEKRKLITQINGAHDGPITGLHCLEATPTMLTSANDNALKMWIFDESEGGARLLNQRSGHSKPPTKIRFHGNSGNVILSAGLDSTLRNFSTIHDCYNRSLGRASYDKKLSKKGNLKQDTLVMPPIVDFVTEISRQSDWDGLLCVHSNESLATTWNFNKSCMGKHKFDCKVQGRPDSRDVHAKCVCLTSCGNFGLVGFSNGCVTLYNMQSGLNRGCYGNVGDGGGDDDGGGGTQLAHNSSITGLFVDDLNKTTVTMAKEYRLKFWAFKSKKFITSLSLAALPMRGVLNRENNLLAIGLNDFSLVVVDVENRKIVRKITGHNNDITDLAFARSGRWLVTSCLDSCIRVYDLYSAILLDIFQLHSPATSISMSPTDELLATTHVDDLGIYLWYNTTLYTNSNLLGANECEAGNNDAVDIVEMPKTKCREEEEGVEDCGSEKPESFLNFAGPQGSAKLGQLGNLITLSNLSESRWLPLSRYDVIKEKNAPKETLMVPKQAPFFLPTKQGLDFEFDRPDDSDGGGARNKKKLINASMRSKLLELMEGCLVTMKKPSADGDNDDDLNKCFESTRDYFLSLYPSAIDMELRCLSLDFGGKIEIMTCFLMFLKYWLAGNNQTELCSAVLDRFIELHSDSLISGVINGSGSDDDDDDVMKLLKNIFTDLDSKANVLREHLDTIDCLISYNRGAAL